LLCSFLFHTLIQINVVLCVWRAAEAAPLFGCSHFSPKCSASLTHFSRSLQVPPYPMPEGETLQSLALIYGVSLQHLALVNPTIRKPFAILRPMSDVQLGIPFRVDPSSNVASVMSSIRRAIGCTPRLLSPVIARNATGFSADSVCVVPQCSK
jgi:hypothetical protein